MVGILSNVLLFLFTILNSIPNNVIALDGPLTYSIKPDDNQTVIAIDAFNSSILIGTSQHIYLYTIKTDSKGIPTFIPTVKTNLAETIQRRNEFLELKLLSPKHFAFCDKSACRLCIHSVDKPSCDLMELRINETISTGIKSASIAYSHPKVLLRFVDTWNRSAILSYYISKKQNNTLEVKQCSLAAPRITNQVTVGSFSRGDYFYFVGSSIQKIDTISNIDPQAYASTTNSRVVKITRVCAKDSSAKLSTQMDLTLECRSDTSVSISEVSRAHFDSTKGNLWFSIQLANGAHRMCKYSIKDIDKKFSEIWDACQKAKSGKTNDCKKISKNSPDHCFIFARGVGDKLDSCSTLKKKSGDNCDISSHTYGWLEYFKPLKEKPVFSLARNDDTVTQVLPEHKTIFYSTYDDTNHYTHIYMRSSKDVSKSAKILKVQSAFKTPRSMAIADNNLFYVNGTTVSIMPMLCEEFYKTCQPPSKKEKKVTIIPVNYDPVTSTSTPLKTTSKDTKDTTVPVTVSAVPSPTPSEEQKIIIVPVNQDSSNLTDVPVATTQVPEKSTSVDGQTAFIFVIVFILLLCCICIVCARRNGKSSSRSTSTNSSMSNLSRRKDSQSQKLIPRHNQPDSVTIEMIPPPDEESSSDSEPERMVIEMVAPPSEESSSDSSSSDSEPEGMEIEMVAPPSDDE